MLQKASEPTAQDKAGWKTWVKRGGIAGFSFFFAKGLLWLLLGAVFFEGCVG